MSLKMKLSLLIFGSTCLPVLLVGGYQAWHTYDEKVEGAQRELTRAVESRGEATRQYLQGVCLDTEAMAQVKEISRLLEGIEEEDEDRIQAMVRRLKQTYSGEATHRGVFEEISLSLPEGECLLQLWYDGDTGAVSSSDDPATAPGSDIALKQGRPLSDWSLESGKPTLWLHHPLGSSEGVLSVKVVLAPLQSICDGEGLYLFRPGSINLYTDEGTFGGEWNPREIEISGKSGAGMDSRCAFAYSVFPPVPWSVEDRFTLVECRSKDELVAPILASLRFVGILLIAVLIISLSVALPLTRSITDALEKVIKVTRSIAQGNLHHKLDVTRNDEIGTLAQAVNKMSDSLRQVIHEVRQGNHTLKFSSEEFKSQSLTLHEGSQDLAEVASTVSAASEELSSTITGIASSADEMSVMMSTVADGLGELDSSIDAIADNGQRSIDISQTAESQAKQTIEIMAELQEATNQIDRILEVITGIADQTNLLALNATIEAAGAGDAGRGFAVVANEVKELASQTTQATVEIKGQIDGMHTRAEHAVSAIDGISGVIEEICEIAGSISQGVDRQSATVKEMALSGDLVRTTSQNIAREVKDSAHATQEISQSMIRVNDSAQQTDQGISRSRQSAEELIQLAQHMDTVTGVFTLTPTDG